MIFKITDRRRYAPLTITKTQPSVLFPWNSTSKMIPKIKKKNQPIGWFFFGSR